METRNQNHGDVVLQLKYCELCGRQFLRQDFSFMPNDPTKLEDVEAAEAANRYLAATTKLCPTCVKKTEVNHGTHV